jgi:hypothetical protein
VRRRIKRHQLDAKMEGTRYVVHVPNARNGQPVVEEVHPSIVAMLDYLNRRDQLRDRELERLHLELARTQADLAAAQAALPPGNGKPWGPFEWLRQRWAAQCA